MTSVNNPQAPASLRRKRPVVKINGTAVGGILHMEVINNQHFQSDYFSIDIALQGQPANLNWASWGEQTDAEIECLIGDLADDGVTISNPVSQIIGLVDRVQVKQPKNMVTIEGRDYSSKLIDQATIEKFPQQTSSQIATTLATRHGLTPQVTATKTPVGSYFGRDYATTTRRQSEWDLLTYLAQQEGFEVFVRGTTLYFQPPTDPAGNPYVIQWVPPSGPGLPPTANCVALSLTREMTLARDVIVTVTSHNSKEGKAVTQTARSVNSARVGRTGKKVGPQTYTVDIPNLTAQQALVRAQQLLKEYSQHERLIEVDLPGDELLTFNTPIQLTGTGTSWDQMYFADQITRRMGFQEGYEMILRAKNHSTTSEVSS